MDQFLKGVVYRPKFITRQFVQTHRNDIFVFGDNMSRKGLGGQAREMRGEPNTIGIPTKWFPSNNPKAFFSDIDWLNQTVIEAICGSFISIEEKLQKGINVHIPFDGLGTGFARLEQKSPIIANFINQNLHDLTIRFPISS